MSQTKASGPKRGKPHNARTTNYANFNELLAHVAAEPRSAVLGGESVKMPRSERLLRLMLDRALQGKVREITKLLQLMAANQPLAATYREEQVTVISGGLCNA